MKLKHKIALKWFIVFLIAEIFNGVLLFYSNNTTNSSAAFMAVTFVFIFFSIIFYIGEISILKSNEKYGELIVDQENIKPWESLIKKIIDFSNETTQRPITTSKSKSFCYHTKDGFDKTGLEIKSKTKHRKKSILNYGSGIFNLDLYLNDKLKIDIDFEDNRNKEKEGKYYCNHNNQWEINNKIEKIIKNSPHLIEVNSGWDYLFCNDNDEILCSLHLTKMGKNPVITVNYKNKKIEIYQSSIINFYGEALN